MPVAQSSHLNSFDYDIGSQTLTIAFNNGSVYHYREVPLQEFENLKQAGSPGTYFWQNIRSKYGTTKIVPSGRTPLRPRRKTSGNV